MEVHREWAEGPVHTPAAGRRRDGVHRGNRHHARLRRRGRRIGHADDREAIDRERGLGRHLHRPSQQGLRKGGDQPELALEADGDEVAEVIGENAVIVRVADWCR